jgi:hypothetical protein
MPTIESADAAPSTSEAPANDTLILGHAVIAGLCELIPVPWVDGLVQNRVKRRMVERLAAHYGLDLWDSEVRNLVDPDNSGWLKKAGKALLLRPLKRLLRKVFFVLNSKKIIESATLAYHQGFLIDEVFRHGWCAPDGVHHARSIRRALDEVLARHPLSTSPVGHAFRQGFARSKKTASAMWDQLRNNLGALDDASIDEAVRSSENAGSDLLLELLDSLTTVPAAHFETLRAEIAKELGEQPNEAADAVVAAKQPGSR